MREAPGIAVQPGARAGAGSSDTFLSSPADACQGDIRIVLFLAGRLPARVPGTSWTVC